MTVRLRKVQLANYRSCVDTEFSLQPDLSVLIGPNGSGKTNILNGLVLLRRLLDEDQFRAARQETPTGECQIKAWFEVDDKTAILTAKVALYTDERNNDVVVTSQQSWYAKDFTGTAKRLKIPLSVARHLGASRDDELMMDDEYIFYLHSRNRRMMHAYVPGFPRDKKSKPAIEAVSRIAKWVAGITYYSASQFTNPSACPVSIEVESEGPSIRRARQRGGTATRLLFDLYSAHERGSDSYRAFEEIVGPRGIQLIDGLSFKKLKTSSVDYAVRVGGQARERRVEKLMVVPQFEIGKNTLSPNQLSDGTFKTIALIFYLLTESRSLLLLEEPEVCVHHGLLASILELMSTQSENQQVVVSTHSDFVIDHVEPRSVYAVSRSSDGGTAISSLTKSMSSRELEALRAYLETEGTLGEYWKHGALD